jgi:hypothetical protein
MIASDLQTADLDLPAPVNAALTWARIHPIVTDVLGRLVVEAQEMLPPEADPTKQDPLRLPAEGV